MKVLYILWNYPQLSETYVAAEIAFALGQGVDVQVWSKLVQKEGVPAQCPVHRGTLAEALAAVRPDVVHVHYLVVADRHAPEIPAEIPVTVRAHSFDWDPALCGRVADFPGVRKVYAFPHFSRQVLHPKMEALPVAYSTKLFKPSPRKDRRMVLRLVAGLPTKGLVDFFAAASELPKYRFVLGVARAGGADQFPETLRAMNAGGRVDLRFDLSWEEAARLTSEAAIYMDTSDPKGHHFGMPISIAEAMATGSFVLARRSPAAQEYLGDAGLVYESPFGAAAAIGETVAWSEDEWARASKAALLRARAFADTAVLPKVIRDWQAMVEKRPHAS